MLSVTVLGLAFVVYVVFSSWRLLNSPLWAIPGPFWSRFTSVPLRWHEFQANRTAYIHQLHLIYGPAVRIAPNEVSFTSFEAVKEIWLLDGSEVQRGFIDEVGVTLREGYLRLLWEEGKF